MESTTWFEEYLRAKSSECVDVMREIRKEGVAVLRDIGGQGQIFRRALREVFAARLRRRRLERRPAHANGGADEASA